ncbi:hypothetical protein L1887_28674 [Cichorium endivia]|nr:hypothetical protein L1887_28674 [Cichorium endivia]
MAYTIHIIKKDLAVLVPFPLKATLSTKETEKVFPVKIHAILDLCRQICAVDCSKSEKVKVGDCSGHGLEVIGEGKGTGAELRQLWSQEKKLEILTELGTRRRSLKSYPYRIVFLSMARNLRFLCFLNSWKDQILV